jgi:hypothetical protein
MTQFPRNNFNFCDILSKLTQFCDDYRRHAMCSLARTEMFFPIRYKLREQERELFFLSYTKFNGKN